jgi:lysozyme
MSNYTVGCDVSKWQGRTDFAGMYQAGARFVFLKASQAMYTDARFIEYYQAARQTPLLIGMYHYLDWTKPAADQAMHFADLIHSYPPDLPPALDYEERNGAPDRKSAAAAATEFMSAVESLAGKPMMAYTSPGYWAEYGVTTAWFAGHPLWIAHYGVTQPTVPLPWLSWRFWQFTSSGDGALYGVESKQIDLDYYNGAEQDLLSCYGRSAEPQQSPPQQPPEGNMIRMQVVISKLNIRSGPAASFGKTGELHRSDIVVIEALHVESPTRVWAKHASGWSAVVYDNSMMMREAV